MSMNFFLSDIYLGLTLDISLPTATICKVLGPMVKYTKLA